MICLISLLSLYIVVDLFTNIEDFTQNQTVTVGPGRQIGIYYGYKVTQIFDRLSEAIALLAAMFTVAWMRAQQRIDSAPVGRCLDPSRRAAGLDHAFAMLGLTIANQELLIPHIGTVLFAEKSDPNGDQQDISCPWAYAPDGIHVDGNTATPKDRTVHEFSCTIPESMASGVCT